MRIKTDLVRTLLLDTITALESGRADAMLRVLGVKAAAGETTTEVTDLAMRVCGGAAFRKEVGVERHDLLGGKHGDHVGGELAGAQSLLAGTADAACMIKGNYAAWMADGTLPAGATRVLAETPAYDHCNFTVGPAAPPALVDHFHALLMAMSYNNPEVRPLMELEGLTEWRDGRVEGYQPLEAAVDAAHFYDYDGTITESDYQY